jgi:hypothetical protein
MAEHGNAGLQPANFKMNSLSQPMNAATRSVCSNPERKDLAQIFVIYRLIRISPSRTAALHGPASGIHSDSAAIVSTPHSQSLPALEQAPTPKMQAAFDDASSSSGIPAEAGDTIYSTFKLTPFSRLVFVDQSLHAKKGHIPVVWGCGIGKG